MASQELSELRRHITSAADSAELFQKGLKKIDIPPHLFQVSNLAHTACEQVVLAKKLFLNALGPVQESEEKDEVPEAIPVEPAVTRSRTRASKSSSSPQPGPSGLVSETDKQLTNEVIISRKKKARTPGHLILRKRWARMSAKEIVSDISDNYSTKKVKLPKFARNRKFCQQASVGTIMTSWVKFAEATRRSVWAAENVERLAFYMVVEKVKGELPSPTSSKGKSLPVPRKLAINELMARYAGKERYLAVLKRSTRSIERALQVGRLLFQHEELVGIDLPMRVLSRVTGYLLGRLREL